MLNELEQHIKHLHLIPPGATQGPEDCAICHTYKEKIEWPFTNTVGSCLCGHSKEGHLINVDDHCLTCQCVSFSLDIWGMQ